MTATYEDSSTDASADQIWAAVGAARAWLDAANGTSDAELGLRILKIVEEAGEAAAAWIGVIGQNPRKGITHTRQQVADELGDVAFTALVAAASLGHDPSDLLVRVAAKVRPRLTAPATLDETGQADSRGALAPIVAGGPEDGSFYEPHRM